MTNSCSWDNKDNLGRSFTATPNLTAELFPVFFLLFLCISSLLPIVIPFTVWCNYPQATTHTSTKRINLCIHSDIMEYTLDAVFLHSAFPPKKKKEAVSGHFQLSQGLELVFFITLSALSSFLLYRALHSQVSSPRNSLTAGAGRVVTVMHGYTA